MKFTKEQVFEHIKSLLTNNGKTHLSMSERSINEQLDTLMPLVANEEMELTDFVDKVKSSFITMNNNAKNDVTTFVNDWKKNHPDVTPQPVQGNNNSGNGESETEKKLRERLEALEKESENNKRNATINEKRGELLAKLKEKGIKNKEWCEGMINEIAIDENLDVEAKANSILLLYNKLSASSGGGGATPRNASGGNNNNQHEFDDIIAARKQKLGISD